MTYFIVSVRNNRGEFENVGMNNRFVTTHYKTLNGLLKYGISEQWKQRGIKVQDCNSNIIYSN